MIRVGIMGAGFMGRNHFNQYEKLGDRCQVVALCDKEADRRAGDWSKVGGNVADKEGGKRDLGDIKPYTEWKDLVADANVDMIDICAPTFLHREISIAALEAGKCVLCEKPMALNVEDCDAMIAAAGKSTGRFMIAQCIRFWPEYVYLKQVFDEQKFGPLRAIHLYRRASCPDYTLGNWIVNPELSGGAILDLHVHDVDFALYLLGKPKSITAQSYERTGGGYDRVHALWDYGNDQVVQLDGCWDMPPGFGFTCGFIAAFETAAVTWDLGSGKPLAVLKPGGDPEKPETPTMPEGDGYFREIDYFTACIERGEDPQTSTPEQSRDAVAIALAEKESARQRKAIPIQ